MAETITDLDKEHILERESARLIVSRAILTEEGNVWYRDKHRICADCPVIKRIISNLSGQLHDPENPNFARVVAEKAAELGKPLIETCYGPEVTREGPLVSDRVECKSGQRYGFIQGEMDSSYTYLVHNPSAV